MVQVTARCVCAIVVTGLAMGSLDPTSLCAVTEKQDPILPFHPSCDIVDRSARIIVAHVGEEFFAKYLYFRSIQLYDTRGGIHERAYYLGKPGARDDGSPRHTYDAKPEVWYSVWWEIQPRSGGRAAIKVDMDTDGRLLGDPGKLQLPDCVGNPSACEFSITAKRAAEIAESADVPTGKSHVMNFCWSEDFGRYVWVVRHTPNEARAGEQEHDRLVLIDANSGDTLMVAEWGEYGQGWK